MIHSKKQKIALVTGGNRGIGKEIARQLALQNYHVLIGCRDAKKGHVVVEELKKDGLSVDLLVLDVNNRRSIEEKINNITDNFGRLDVLVNNAGIILDRGVSVLDVEESVLKETFETNFFGAFRITQAVIPLMRQHKYGRIVNLSSGLSSFEIMSGQGPIQLHGSSSAYRISKTMLNALTCLVAQEVTDMDIKINAVCPGRVQTDMGGIDAPNTVEQGADTAVWLATLGEDGPNGGYFRDRKQITW
jgi:NAD(P)-dependent dehydrogenase (short-subunit alcohol dehydrogenase family)